MSSPFWAFWTTSKTVWQVIVAFASAHDALAAAITAIRAEELNNPARPPA